MTKVDALKALYTALGGEDDLSAVTKTVDVLNAISALNGGKSDATLIASAISNISAAVAEEDNGGDLS